MIRMKRNKRDEARMLSLAVAFDAGQKLREMDPPENMTQEYFYGLALDKMMDKLGEMGVYLIEGGGHVGESDFSKKISQHQAG